MKDPQRPLVAGFLESARRFRDRPAFSMADDVVTYSEFHLRSAALAARLAEHDAPEGPALTAVFGYRTSSVFTGVMAALLRGHGYVPLNPNFPADRTRDMLQQSGCRSVIVDSVATAGLAEVLDGVDDGLLLVFPDATDLDELAGRFPGHTVVGPADDASAAAFTPVLADPDSIAYVLFTSGSTGRPKGVMVAQRNVTCFLDVMCERYALTEADRLSQMFDMVFDLSVFDMFMAWEVGACICCPTRAEVMIPADYVEESGITIWFSVPSVGVLLKRLGRLDPGLFPKLRLSLFCGEALPAAVASAWQEAAPNSIVENLYGPTEVTLACTLYRWDSEASPAECENGLVPIGHAYPNMTALVADEALREVEPGEPGELLMSGPQVALGYWNDPEKTAKAFCRPPGREEIHYRTGDLVYRRPDTGTLVYKGRIDDQVKVHGMRVELGEIEAVLREAAGVERTVALGWPPTPTGFDGVVAFLETRDDLDQAAVRQRARARLPGYMVPREIRTLAEFPLNLNGKIDRPALRKLLNNESRGTPWLR